MTASTILEEVMALTAADLGNVQIADPVTQELKIAESAGFNQEFLDYFAIVDDDTSACGRAAAQHAQAVVSDVDSDEAFTPHRDIAAASKFRAVQSTPLIDTDGNLIGMVSTHFPRPGAPTARTLELTRLYGMVAGEALARSLPARAEPRLETPHGDDPASPEASTTLPRATVLELTDTIVRSLLSAGLSLAGAQSLIGDGAANERVAAAIDELDHLLGGVRSAVLDLHT
jgi:GAF domain-containing protein